MGQAFQGCLVGEGPPALKPPRVSSSQAALGITSRMRFPTNVMHGCVCLLPVG